MERGPELPGPQLSARFRAGRRRRVVLPFERRSGAVAGIAEVVEAAHADPSAFDPESDYFDPKSKPDAPTWFQVTIKPVQPVAPPIPLARLREIPALVGMELLRKGSRLSVQPVSEAEWKTVLELAGIKPRKSRKG